jgi:branched-chain amino acid transport system ATP-binding protein
MLGDMASVHAKDLSGGQQQILALAQAFVGSPKVLLCDEPSLGLATALIPEIMRFIRQLADDGIGVLIVEQVADVALSIADRAIVLRQGLLVAQGAPAEFKNRDRLLELFLEMFP